MSGALFHAAPWRFEQDGGHPFRLRVVDADGLTVVESTPRAFGGAKTLDDHHRLVGWPDDENTARAVAANARQIDKFRAIASLPDLYAALEIVSACGHPVRCSVGEPEDGVEGWRWTRPGGREWFAAGSWDAPPMHPLASAALAKARGEVRS